MSGRPTHYDRLGVASGATIEQIRSAYRAAARRVHPDAGPLAGGSTDEMAAVNEAWRVLSDPGRRAAYDRQLAADRSAGSAAPAGGPGPSRGPVVDEEQLRRVLAYEAHSGRRGRFPIWPFVILFILAAIFIVTAGALSSEPQPLGPDNMLATGSCVLVAGDNSVRETDCAGPHDAVVEVLVGFDQTCPANTTAYRDAQGRGWACLRPG